MGLWILENANLEALAEACRQRNCWEFLMCVGPVRLFNSMGSPLNPIAVFCGQGAGCSRPACPRGKGVLGVAGPV